jgi:Stress up-regulated Nod 19
LIGAHLHDGGTAVNLYHNGKLYCTSNAIYGGGSGSLSVDGKSVDTIAKLTECNEPLKVKVGDTLKVEAFYDTTKHPLRISKGQEQEAMAIMGTMFADDKSS